jgi:hypothetical protein
MAKRHKVGQGRRRRAPVSWNQVGRGNAHVSDAQEGFWAKFPAGTSAQDVLDTYLSTANYVGSTKAFRVTAGIGGDFASVRIEPGGDVRWDLE